jgi:expansin (peptidoglycan-binding protein)
VGRLGTGAAGAALVAVLGLAACGAEPACAAPAAGAALPAAAGAVLSGKATYYTGTGAGNCMFEPPADGLFVALGNEEYGGAAACGGYLDVTGPKGKVRVKVADRCPECARGHLDLSEKAFARIAEPVQGIVAVTYRAVTDPPLSGLTFRIKEGASRYWFAVRVDNHGNPLRTVEAKAPGGTWRATVRQDYNYWLVESGLGPGPYAVRVTDSRGRTATVRGVDLRPGVVQRTDIRLGGDRAPAASPGPTRPTPRPSATRRSQVPAPARSLSTFAPKEVEIGTAGWGGRPAICR